MSDDTEIKEEKPENIVQPRTLRLLKLICSSHTSSDHTRLAIKLLSITASKSSPTVLWDIIFRLYNSLTHPDEDSKGGCSMTRRQNVALAMEYVAKYIPKSDQQNFLSDTNDALFHSETSQSSFMTVKTLLEDDGGMILLDRIISTGQQLLSSNESNYDTDEKNIWSTENVFMKPLTSLKHDQTSITKLVKWRVKMQKTILAQRMGLRGLESFIDLDDISTILHSTLTDKELELPLLTKVQDNRDHTTAPNACSGKVNCYSRQRSKDRLKKRRRLQNNLPSDQEQFDTDSEHSPTRLLLLKSLQRQSNSIVDSSCSQKNPQILIASDFIFHSFNPNWHIRHGSLLGLLALLKAWDDRSKQSTKEKYESHISMGRWPKDILTRCLCIIGLDRFNDFSGLTLDNIRDVINSRSHSKAVVRDAAAQIISFLFLHNAEIQDDCILVLSHLLCHEHSWDVRHGSIITLRWILSRSSSHTVLHFCDTFISLIVIGLRDISDDVRSASAELLSTLVLSEIIPIQLRNNCIQRTSAPLWEAIKCHHVSASNTVTVLQTLSDCVKKDCGLVVGSIEASVSEVLHEISVLARSSSITITFCCLEMLPLLLDSLIFTISEADSVFEYKCELLQILFDLYYSTTILDSIEEDDNSNYGTDYDSFYSVLGDAWNSLLRSLSVFIMDSNQSNMRRILGAFMVQFCALDSSSASFQYRIDSKIGLIFKSIESSAKALVMCLKTFSENLSYGRSLFMFMTLSLLNSPWNEDFERGCILLRTYISIMTPCNHEMNVFHPLAIDSLESGPKYCHITETEFLQDKSVIKSKCAFALKDSILASATFTTFSYSDAINLSQKVVQKWLNFLPQPNDTHIQNPAGISLKYMRTVCSLSQTIAFFEHQYMPLKLTPLVRNLVTHLKNEECSDRLKVTVAALVSLMKTLNHSDNVSHAKVSCKLMRNICFLAETDSVKSGRCTEKGCNAAREVIQELVFNLENNETLEGLDPIWKVMNVLIYADSHFFREKIHEEAVWMLRIVSKRIRKQSSACAHLIANFLPKITTLACTSSSIVIRNHSIAILKNLCELDSVSTLSRILHMLFQYLSSDDDAFRLGSCNLLNSIVKTADSSICPYIRYLLPSAMSMMIDTVQEIADASANTFSHLVRLSPLVSHDSSTDCFEFSTVNIEVANGVIDHLILGNPLPPYSFPEKLQSYMTKNGIKLRDYQLDGISWMRFLQSVKLNGALCDDMGLGKTIQSLIAVAIVHEEIINKNPDSTPKSLVICPLSVCGQWINEIKKLCLGDQADYAFRYIGTNRTDEWQRKFQRCQVVVTSYATLRSDVDFLKGVQWEYCILDEGHLLKNPKTKSAQAARALKAKHKLILTGTPVQNKAHELWAIFDFLMPNYLGTEIEFKRKYDNVIKRSQLPGASSTEVHAATSALKQLHQNVLPFILRREKEKVIKELPDKIFIDVPCCMTPYQRSVYGEVSSNKSVRDALTIIDAIVEDKCSGIENNANDVANIGKDALRSIMNLRLICTHPSLTDQSEKKPTNSLLSFSTSGKLQALNDILRQTGIYQDELTGADNDESLIYLQESTPEYVEVTDDVVDESYFDHSGNNYYNVDQNASSPTKCLIFAQFNKSLDVLESLLLKPCMPSLCYRRIDGRTKTKDRENILKQFGSDDNLRCLLLSTKAGSLGLNLQQANIVIFLEQDWNPFVDEQALCRAHRIGQEKCVRIFRIICENSIEEKIMKVQRIKLKMSKAIVTTENSSFCSMGTERLLDIFDTGNDSS